MIYKHINTYIKTYVYTKCSKPYFPPTLSPLPCDPPGRASTRPRVAGSNPARGHPFYTYLLVIQSYANNFRF